MNWSSVNLFSRGGPRRKMDRLWHWIPSSNALCVL
jgi:hypothetical protein